MNPKIEPKIEEIEVRIEGLVQGVGYRAAARETARGLGLVGWVRNEGDGAVTLYAQGPGAALESLLLWCRRGPTFARVDDVRLLRRTAIDGATFGHFDVSR